LPTESNGVTRVIGFPFTNPAIATANIIIMAAQNINKKRQSVHDLSHTKPLPILESVLSFSASSISFYLTILLFVKFINIIGKS
jgi:hypothetical protein